MVKIVEVISFIIREEHGIQCMLRSSRIMSDVLHVPEIHTVEMFDFLKSSIQSKVI